MAEIVQPPKTSRYKADIKAGKNTVPNTHNDGFHDLYVNGWDVWKNHPSQPYWLDSNGKGEWFIFKPANQQPAGAVARGGIGGEPRRGWAFKTFVEAVAWARTKLGVKGWECVTMGRGYVAGWFPNDEWAGVTACEETIHGDGYGGGINKCGRPVVGMGEGYWSSRGIQPLCAVHMGVHKRKESKRAERAEQAAERRKKDEERDRERKVAEDAVARLRGWGLKAQVGRPENGSGYDPLVNGEMIVALVERFEMACREMGMDFDEEIADLTKGGRV